LEPAFIRCGVDECIPIYLPPVREEGEYHHEEHASAAFL